MHWRVGTAGKKMEMVLQRNAKAKWTEKVTNKDILKIAGEKRQI